MFPSIQAATFTPRHTRAPGRRVASLGVSVTASKHPNHLSMARGCAKTSTSVLDAGQGVQANSAFAGRRVVIENLLRLPHPDTVNGVWNRMMLMAGMLIFAGCQKPADPRPALDIDPLRGHLLHAQPKLPTIKVWLGDQELITEIATEPVQIATGMMFRTNMPDNSAMIFVFPNAQPRNFYMRNCVVPLSAGYIAPDGTLLEIVDLQPGDEVGVQSKSHNIQFVLEVPQGWFNRHNLSPGAMVRTERGSLWETFFPRRR
jgi:uncharacterized protein